MDDDENFYFEYGAAGEINQSAGDAKVEIATDGNMIFLPAFRSRGTSRPHRSPPTKTTTTRPTPEAAPRFPPRPGTLAALAAMHHQRVRRPSLMRRASSCRRQHSVCCALR